MAIEFHCSQCGQLLRVPDSSRGKGARCPGCKAVMVVPAASDLALRPVPSLSQPSVPPPSPPVPAPSAAGHTAPPPAATSAQDDLFAYLKQAVTPNAPPPAAYQQPGVLPDRPFADPSPASPFSDQPAAASANPYASPAPVAYPTYPSELGERP